MTRGRAEQRSCVWTLDDFGGDSVWETQCGHAFQWTTDGPKENDAAYCCYCGGTLVESRTSDEPAQEPRA